MWNKLKIIWNLLFAKQYFYASSNERANSKVLTSNGTLCYVSDDAIPPFLDTIRTIAGKMHSESLIKYQCVGSKVHNYNFAIMLLGKGVRIYLANVDDFNRPTNRNYSYRYKDGKLIETNDKGKTRNISFDIFRKIWDETNENNMMFYIKHFKKKMSD